MTEENDQARKPKNGYRQAASVLEAYRDEFYQSKCVELGTQSQSQRQAYAVDESQQAGDRAQNYKQCLHSNKSFLNF